MESTSIKLAATLIPDRQAIYQDKILLKMSLAEASFYVSF